MPHKLNLPRQAKDAGFYVEARAVPAPMRGHPDLLRRKFFAVTRSGVIGPFDLKRDAQDAATTAWLEDWEPVYTAEAAQAGDAR